MGRRMRASHFITGGVRVCRAMKGVSPSRVSKSEHGEVNKVNRLGGIVTRDEGDMSATRMSATQKERLVSLDTRSPAWELEGLCVR